MSIRSTILIGCLALVASPALAANAPVLTFSTALSPTHAAVKALLEQQSGATIEDKWLNIAPIDLDGDGTPELFVMPVNTDYFCGDAGCRPTIFKSDGAGWKQIDIGLNDFTNSDPGMWSVDAKPQNGHLVLVLTESNFTARFAWDGTAYSSPD